MELTKTNFDGLFIINNNLYQDNRGSFIELHNQKKFENIFGKINFVQDNESESKFGVLRGLHFQIPPFSQCKLVRCSRGEVLDVVLDLRKNSKTYLKSHFIKLSEKNKTQLLIPRGFAHGFIVLSPKAIFSYKVDQYYNQKYERGIFWNDPELNIDWPINKDKIIVSEKDKNLPLFSNTFNPF